MELLTFNEEALEVYKHFFDAIEDQTQSLTIANSKLCTILDKSRDQVIRVAGAMAVLERNIDKAGIISILEPSNQVDEGVSMDVSGQAEVEQSQREGPTQLYVDATSVTCAVNVLSLISTQRQQLAGIKVHVIMYLNQSAISNESMTEKSRK